jgi:dTDP-glucose 4,6-dehydratase
MLLSVYKSKKMLVTGAAGFIGSNFVKYMLGKHADLQVVSFDKLTYAGSKDNLAQVLDDPRHQFILGDICDESLVADTLKTYDIDTIVHFAAESHVDNSIAGPKVFIETNINGTFTLLEAAKHYWQEVQGWGTRECRFHHVSTDEVYGSLKKSDPAFTETTAYAPNSPYSASKASSDHLVRSYFHTYKLPVTISNCSNNYGPNQHKEKLIPVVVDACMKGKPIPVYGDGSNIRDWLFVEDHCSAIEAILSEGRVGEVYNVGSNNELSNLELIHAICAAMDAVVPKAFKHESLITFVEDRKGHDWRYAIDSSKIHLELGWSVSTSFLDVLHFTIKRYLESLSASKID